MSCLSLVIGPCRKVGGKRDAHGHLRSYLSLTCPVEAARNVFRVILLGAALCAPVFGQSPPATSSVTLAWDKSPSHNVKGYRLHYGTAPRKYQGVMDVGKKTTCKIVNLIPGKKYYFVVGAYNAAGRESLPSNECAFVAPKLAKPK
jgi:Fibronectin type III domain